MGGMLNRCKSFWLSEMNREKTVYSFILTKLMHNILTVVSPTVKAKLSTLTTGRRVGSTSNKDKFFAGDFQFRSTFSIYSV